MRNLEGVVNKRLDKLTIEFCDDFLRYAGNGERIIGLCEADRETLQYLKIRMDEYFKARGEEVSVHIGRGGYSINVGYFID